MKKQKKRYIKWITKYGYKNDPLSLLWYYNRKNKAKNTQNGYMVNINHTWYNPEELFKKWFA